MPFSGLLKSGGSLPEQNDWASLLGSISSNTNGVNNDWESTLKIAESAALPAETLLEQPSMCEDDSDKRMTILTEHERQTIDFTCFDARLENQNINSDQVHRVLLMEQAVYKWLLGTNETTRANFANIIEGFKPAPIRRAGIKQALPHRRAVIGATSTFELLAVKIGTEDNMVVLCSPFVHGENEGLSSFGLLVWAVVPDEEASLYKTLISNTEVSCFVVSFQHSLSTSVLTHVILQFMRHKTKTDDRFLKQKERHLVLELGKDVSTMSSLLFTLFVLPITLLLF